MLSPGFEEAIFGLEEDLCGVDEVVPRLKARGPVWAEVTLRGVVHRRRCEHDRSGDGEVGDVLGDGHAIIGRGEADPVQHPVSLGQKVLATVGGMVLGHGRDHRLSGIVEDRLGEVAGVQQRQVVAAGKARDPGQLFVLGYVTGCPLSPSGGQLGEAAMGLLGPGGDRGNLPETHRLDDGRAASMGINEARVELVSRAAICSERCENSAMRASGTPVIS